MSESALGAGIREIILIPKSRWETPMVIPSFLTLFLFLEQVLEQSTKMKRYLPLKIVWKYINDVSNVFLIPANGILKLKSLRNRFRVVWNSYSSTLAKFEGISNVRIALESRTNYNSIALVRFECFSNVRKTFESSGSILMLESNQRTLEKR